MAAQPQIPKAQIQAMLASLYASRVPQQPQVQPVNLGRPQPQMIAQQLRPVNLGQQQTMTDMQIAPEAPLGMNNLLIDDTPEANAARRRR
jgi:hypothetical protein